MFYGQVQRIRIQLFGTVIKFEFVYTRKIQVLSDHKKKKKISPFGRIRKHYSRLNRRYNNRQMDEIIHDFFLPEIIFNTIFV